jgi:hypothetical protein
LCAIGLTFFVLSFCKSGETAPLPARYLAMSSTARILAVIAIWTATAALPALAADTQECTPQERANQTLSEELGELPDVICPPDVDPEMQAPPPAQVSQPPPGSPGGNPNVGLK